MTTKTEIFRIYLKNTALFNKNDTDSLWTISGYRGTAKPLGPCIVHEIHLSLEKNDSFALWSHTKNLIFSSFAHSITLTQGREVTKGKLRTQSRRWELGFSG